MKVQTTAWPCPLLHWLPPLQHVCTENPVSVVSSQCFRMAVIIVFKTKGQLKRGKKNHSVSIFTGLCLQCIAIIPCIYVALAIWQSKWALCTCWMEFHHYSETHRCVILILQVRKLSHRNECLLLWTKQIKVGSLSSSFSRFCSSIAILKYHQKSLDWFCTA